jgi:hypothetical protein
MVTSQMLIVEALTAALVTIPKVALRVVIVLVASVKVACARPVSMAFAMELRVGWIVVAGCVGRDA